MSQSLIHNIYERVRMYGDIMPSGAENRSPKFLGEMKLLISPRNYAEFH